MKQPIDLLLEGSHSIDDLLNLLVEDKESARKVLTSLKMNPTVGDIVKKLAADDGMFTGMKAKRALNKAVKALGRKKGKPAPKISYKSKGLTARKLDILKDKAELLHKFINRPNKPQQK